MNLDTLKGQFNQLSGSLKQWWGKLTDDDITYIGGSIEKLIGKLQERYGYSREQAESEVQNRLGTRV